MFDLNPEQRQRMINGEPVRVVDPITHEAYVLMRAEVYARLSERTERSSVQPNPEIPPIVLRSQQAFWRDRPELLKDEGNRGNWVAYHGPDRVAFGRTDTEVYQECFHQGLKRGEFYVGRLEDDPDEIPPWGTFHVDWSFFEVTERTPPHQA
jgi:hypothetical protein